MVLMGFRSLKGGLEVGRMNQSMGSVTLIHKKPTARFCVSTDLPGSLVVVSLLFLSDCLFLHLPKYLVQERVVQRYSGFEPQYLTISIG